MAKARTMEERLEKIDLQLEHIAETVVKGFAATDKNIETVDVNLRQSIDVYARAVDAYAKQAETYMQEMLALGEKVDRLERQIQEIAEHLNLKLSY